MPANNHNNQMKIEEIPARPNGIKPVLAYVTWDSFKPATCFNMLQLTGSGLFSITMAACGSLLPFTRNQMINNIYRAVPDFTHIMMVDADMAEISPECVDGMFAADVDIISPIMTQRVPPFIPCIQPGDYPRLVEQMHREPTQRQVIEVATTGLGCMLVKRKVFDEIGEPLPDGDKMWFHIDRQLRKSFPDECNNKVTELQEKEWEEKEDPIKESFLQGVKFGLGANIGAEYMGEDYSFCIRARRNGFKIFLDTRHAITHIGDVQYGVEDWAITTQGKEMDSRLERHTKVFYERGSNQIFGHQCPRPSNIHVLDRKGSPIHQVSG